MKTASAEGRPETQNIFIFQKDIFTFKDHKRQDTPPGLVMIGELYSFFRVMNSLIGGLKGCNTVSALIGFCLFQLCFCFSQMLQSGLHMRLLFNRCGSHGYWGGEEGQQENQCYRFTNRFHIQSSSFPQNN
ncbi:MAG TPA: hypothetical protein VGK22_09385 [Candidatus Angelobacter sp.]|jgi:hypothetical protein